MPHATTAPCRRARQRANLLARSLASAAALAVASLAAAQPDYGFD